jgi:hypothetical protein
MSEGGERIRVRNNEVWFTQGGAQLCMLLGCVGGPNSGGYCDSNQDCLGGSCAPYTRNLSRLVRYRPTSGGWDCININVTNCIANGFTFDEADAAVWIACGRFLQPDGKLVKYPLREVSSCSSSVLAMPAQTISLPAGSYPAHVEINAHGGMWVSEAFGDGVAAVNPVTGAFTEFQLFSGMCWNPRFPDAQTNHQLCLMDADCTNPSYPVCAGRYNWLAGAQPWNIRFDAEGFLWVAAHRAGLARFDAARALRGDPACHTIDLDNQGLNPCISEFYPGGYHSVAVEQDTTVWATATDTLLYGTWGSDWVLRRNPGKTAHRLPVPQTSTSLVIPGGVSVAPDGAVWYAPYGSNGICSGGGRNGLPCNDTIFGVDCPNGACAAVSERRLAQFRKVFR